MELFRSNVKIVGWAVDLGLCSLVLLSWRHGHGCSSPIIKWKEVVDVESKVDNLEMFLQIADIYYLVTFA